MFLRGLILFIIIVLVEWYFLQALKTISVDYTPNKRKIILYIAYALMAFNLMIGAIALVYPPPEWNNLFRFVSSLGLILLLCKLIGCTFLLVDDLIRLIRWVVSLFQKTPIEAIEGTTNHISRLKFLSQVAVTFTVVPAISFIYGMVRGAYKYRIHTVKVTAPNLPDAFIGFKIVQLSDMHSGSFYSTEPLVKALPW